MKSYRIGLIPGDGIGPEVTAQAVKVMEAAGSLFGFSLELTHYPYGAEHYLSTRQVLPDHALEEMEGLDALLLGAIGDPRVQPGILERGILLKLRFHFDQYANIRPVRSFTPGPLGSVNAVVIRENTEDLYVGIGSTGDGAVNLPLEVTRGGYVMKGQLSAFTTPPKRFAMQVAWHTLDGAARACQYAFDLALDLGAEEVTLATKSNAVRDLYGIFENACHQVASQYESVSLRVENVDALCYKLVRSPGDFRVILCPNMFGDIVSDLLAGIGGGMGLAPSGNVGDRLSMFEPVHGSAPDIAGQDRANPVASILSGAMLLRHLGETYAAKAMEDAVQRYLSGPVEELPIEMGGRLGTRGAGDAVVQRLGESP